MNRKVLPNQLIISMVFKELWWEQSASEDEAKKARQEKAALLHSCLFFNLTKVYDKIYTLLCTHTLTSQARLVGSEWSMNIVVKNRISDAYENM